MQVTLHVIIRVYVFQSILQVKVVEVDKIVIRKTILCPERDLNWGLQHWEPGALPSCYRKGVD